MPAKPLRSGSAYLGRVRISRDATLGRSLTVAGRSDLQGGTTVTNGLTVDDLTVTGTVVLPPLTFSDLTVSNTLTVGGVATLNGGATVTGGLATDTLACHSSAVLDTTLRVDGVTTLNGGASVQSGLATDGLNCNGPAIIGTTLHVDSDATIDGTLSAGATDINVRLNVNGPTQLRGTTAFAQSLDAATVVSSATSISLDTSFYYFCTSTSTLDVTVALGGGTGRWYRIVPFYLNAGLASWSLTASSIWGITIVTSNGTIVPVAANQVVSNITVPLVDIVFGGTSAQWLVVQRLNNDILVT
jgi:hypothetical protein